MVQTDGLKICKFVSEKDGKNVSKNMWTDKSRGGSVPKPQSR